MNDFSTPRRMGGSAFVFLFLKNFKEFIALPVIFFGYKLYQDYGNKSPREILLTVATIFVATIAIALLAAFAGYYFKKFHIKGDKLIFSYGFLSKNTTSIPLSKVHTFRTKKGLFYRLLDIRGISFDTLATNMQELELILDEHDWQALLADIKKGENLSDRSYRSERTDLSDRSDQSDRSDWSDSISSAKEETVRISNSNIIKGALCQNHLKGFAVLAAVFFSLLDNISQLGEDAYDRLFNYIDDQASSAILTPLQWICIFALLYLVVMLLWTGKIALRYGNMLLKITKDRIAMESGLISRFTCRVPRDKATILKIKQNPLERLFGCQTVSIQQASNATMTKDGGDIRIYGSNLGGRLLSWWLGDISRTSSAPLLSAHSGIGIFFRRFIPNLILAIAAAFVLIHFQQTVLAIVVGISYALITALRAAMAWRHSSISLSDSYLQVNCGNIATISKYIRYKDIESVSVTKTPFTPYTKRVTLVLATNAETSAVASLDMETAYEIRNLIFSKACAHEHRVII